METKSKPGHASRLNRVVFGVALLWLATSALLLALVWTGSMHAHHPHAHHPHKDQHQQFARLAHQAAALASFIY
jgi:hypothetical protein